MRLTNSWKWRGRVLAALATLWLAQSHSNADEAARPTSAYVGRWAFQVDERNLFVLSLEPGAGSPSPKGVWMRPQHLSIDSNRYVSGVSMPTVSETLRDLSLNTQGLHFAVQNPNDKSIDEFELDLTGPRSAALKFLGAPGPIPPLIMVRVDSEARVASDWDPERVYSTQELHADSREMARLFEADQADRKDVAHVDWAAMAKADRERRRAVRALLARGELHTGFDFFGAAFVFQHGDTPEDRPPGTHLGDGSPQKGQARRDLDRGGNARPISPEYRKAPDIWHAVSDTERPRTHDPRTLRPGDRFGRIARRARRAGTQGPRRPARRLRSAEREALKEVADARPWDETAWIGVGGDAENQR